MEQSVFSVENTDWRRTGKALRIVFSPVPASDVCHLCFLVPDRGRKPWRVPHPRSVPVLPHAPGTDCPGCVSRWTSRRWRGCRSLSGWNESHTCLEHRVNYPESQNINMSRTIDTNDKMLIRDSVHMRCLVNISYIYFYIFNIFNIEVYILNCLYLSFYVS